MQLATISLESKLKLQSQENKCNITTEIIQL